MVYLSHITVGNGNSRIEADCGGAWSTLAGEAAALETTAITDLLPPRFIVWRDDYFSSRVKRLQVSGCRL